MKARGNRAITGGVQPEYLLFPLRQSIKNAESIDLIVSFLMESGVRLLIDELKDAVRRGVPVRILTGNYLGITQPSALYLLRREFGYQIDLRFFNEPERSFHAKSYIFHYSDFNEIYVGSSNVSRSALTDGIEWNYRFSDRTDPESYQHFYATYEDLYRNHAVIVDDDVLKKYSDSWHSPALYRDLRRYDAGSEHSRSGEEEEQASGDVLGESRPAYGKMIPFYQPRGAQIEALYRLDRSRAEGAQKALVQAATGIGKTYLAAFDSLPYRRVLFVAHREEILRQAQKSFHNVRPNDSTSLFNGAHKETKADLIFASVETLGQEKYLNGDYFDPEDFDYIVIDEFHHAVTDWYRRIIDYFHPKFMLGLTATPERMDGRNIYELCDYNVPFELNLRDAINKGYLCPFHYYGIYDATDYSGLHVVRGHYEEKELNEAYIGNTQRYDLIYKQYRKYVSRRALGFCCSRKHAEDMAREFSERGTASAAVYSGASGKYAVDRAEAIEKLEQGQIQVIFSVDMFNEGLDVPDVDMVMFLRPTESPVIFLQQLGRGLRLSPGKSYLNVLDFIGNYRFAGKIPEMLAQNAGNAANITGERQRKDDYPDGCIVDFDLRLIDLFHRMQQNSRGMGERIDDEIDRIKDQIGHVPGRMELFTYMDSDIYNLCMSHTSLNVFRDYLAYLKKRGWLTMEETEVWNYPEGREFLRLISQTAMVKVYKMPILKAFYNDGHPLQAVTDEQVLTVWKKFFNTGTNWRDFDPKSTYEKYRKITDKQHLKKAHDMPIHFLLKSGEGFFVTKEGYAIALTDALAPILDNPAFIRHFGDIIDYRTMHYYRSRYEDRKKGKFLFSLKVNKSLLSSGFAVPASKVSATLNALEVKLDKGEKSVVQVEMDGFLYYANLVSLDFSNKYKDQRRIQVRYSNASELAEQMKTLFEDDVNNKTGRTVSVYAAGKKMLQIQHD